MKHEHNVIENSIFHSCREEMKKIEAAIEILKINNYIVYEKKKKK